MVKNSDSKAKFKMSERQKKIAGKMPFHRLFKLQKILQKLVNIGRRRK